MNEASGELQRFPIARVIHEAIYMQGIVTLRTMRERAARQFLDIGEDPSLTLLLFESSLQIS